LEIVRLQGYAQRRIDTLSGGERQRVAIARSLASSPRSLLLDEPFSSLDAPLRKNLRRDFLEIRKHSKAPCIFVTHDREEALMLGDKAALMKDGRIVETAAGRDLLLAPKTEFAALFFGAGQVLPCSILKKSESGIDVSSPLGALTIPHEPDFDYLINDSIPPKLFVPEDAVCFEAAAPMAAAAPVGHRSFNAQYTGSIFEGKNLVLKFLLEPREGEQFNFEISAGARMNVPEQNAVLKLSVNQNLLRLVKAQSAE
jgi:ABC-type Fe3+/spermidine/putrescine transport system ATPase subunit